MFQQKRERERKEKEEEEQQSIIRQMGLDEISEASDTGETEVVDGAFEVDELDPHLGACVCINKRRPRLLIILSCRKGDVPGGRK